MQGIALTSRRAPISFAGLVFKTSLLVNDRSFQEVHLCGIDTDACVTACALDLFSMGLRPIVLADACARTGGKEFHEAALRALARSLGSKGIQRIARRFPELG